MTLYVLHRGGAAQWPENSLLAFHQAIAGGSALVELDVHQTADGQVAVIHDPTLDRTTDSSGPVAARTARELRQVRLRGPDGRLTDQHVPTLDEVLAVIAGARVALLVEIKTPGVAVRYERVGGTVTAVPGPRYAGLEQAVLERLQAAGLAGRSVILAFNPAVLAAVRALGADLQTALLIDREHLAGAGVPGAPAVAWAAEAGASVLGLHYTLCDDDVVTCARQAGIGLGVFTVNDEAEMRRLAALGVDVIMTDRADLVARLGAEDP
jgi:glycerophosphoryl diester phosphodiesterase